MHSQGARKARLLLLAMVGVIATLAAPSAPAEDLTLSTPAFDSQEHIPTTYTCDGQGIAPALHWQHIPSGTRSLALIVTDPDAPDPAAPKTTWVHWIVYDLPATSRGLQQGTQADALPTSARNGENSWQHSGYGAPCPPIGQHRYIFTLYALDTRLPNLDTPDRAKLTQAMAGHILAKTQIVGLYRRP